MRKPLESRTVVLSFAWAVTVLAWISLASFWTTHNLVRSFDAVDQVHRALDLFQYIEVLMESAEASVCRYAATGEEGRLDAYRYARMVIPFKVRELEPLISSRPQQQQRLEQLHALLQDQLDYLANGAAVRRRQGAAAAARWLVTEDNATKRDKVEHLLSELQQEERAQLRHRSNFTARHSLEAKAVLALTALLSFGLLAWLFRLVRREAADRRHAESATERTQRFLRSIIDRIPYMIMVKEAENLRLTLANKAAAEWLGRSQEDLLASNAFDLRPQAQAHEEMQKDRRALQEGRPVDIPEEAFIQPGTEQRVLHTQKITVPDEQGNPAFLVTISEDITQRKQAERMLELSRDAALESARLKAEFLRNMSHEFRTPLSVIIGMTSLLLDSSLDAEQNRFAATVQRAAQGLSNLTKDILDFSKIEAGTFTLESQEFNVRQIVDGVIGMLSAQAESKGVSLAAMIPANIPSILIGDGVRLRQVLTQLVGNAVKFTPKGEVIVRVNEVRKKDGSVWLHGRITDTGIGIDQETQKHLFEVFRQGDGSRTRRFGGTGLGLAMSKRIVELMGGEIGFDSEPGHGSTFWWTIPFKRRQAQGPVVEVPSLPWTRTRVLVVDENETVRQLFRQQLSLWALASEAVSTGEAALALLRREQKAGRPFAIVLADMHLPDMDGVALAQTAKKDSAIAATQILAMTSAESPIEDETIRSLGFAGWVPKPPKPELLYERLSLLIDPTSPDHQHAA